eukprot:3509603-Pyramimonas_sp.AAC.1
MRLTLCTASGSSTPQAPTRANPSNNWPSGVTCKMPVKPYKLAMFNLSPAFDDVTARKGISSSGKSFVRLERPPPRSARWSLGLGSPQKMRLRTCQIGFSAALWALLPGHQGLASWLARIEFEVLAARVAVSRQLKLR